MTTTSPTRTGLTAWTRALAAATVKRLTGGSGKSCKGSPTG